MKFRNNFLLRKLSGKHVALFLTLISLCQGAASNPPEIQRPCKPEEALTLEQILSVLKVTGKTGGKNITMAAKNQRLIDEVKCRGVNFVLAGHEHDLSTAGATKELLSVISSNYKLPWPPSTPTPAPSPIPQQLYKETTPAAAGRIPDYSGNWLLDEEQSPDASKDAYRVTWEISQTRDELTLKITVIKYESALVGGEAPSRTVSESYRLDGAVTRKVNPVDRTATSFRTTRIDDDKLDLIRTDVNGETHYLLNLYSQNALKVEETTRGPRPVDQRNKRDLNFRRQ